MRLKNLIRVLKKDADKKNRKDRLASLDGY